MKAAYLHIPFCEHICHYCDFNKVLIKNQPVDEYLLALEKEIKLTFQKVSPTPLHSIFVGGGTPTSLTDKQLITLCTIIANNLPMEREIEFTFEANPGDLTEEKINILRSYGVNRLSVGVQSFNNELLKKIGRTHEARDVYRTIEFAKKGGVENISIDLMYGLPGQTLEDFKTTLSEAFALGIPHFSAYSLIIEPKTVFYNLINKKKLTLPSEDVEGDMYELLIDEMETHGYKQYEISNFSIPGFESIHNLTYWNNDHYYGFGAGAHSYINGVRRSNFGPLKKYMNAIHAGALPIMEEHELSVNEMMEEEMFLGLRKRSGVDRLRFLKKYKKDPVDLFQNELHILKQKGFITVNNDSICLTKKGLFLGNEVFQSFIGVL